MNNTTRAEALRVMMSRKLTPFEIETMQESFILNIAEIELKINRLAMNEKNAKALSAINYILSTLND